MPRSSRSAADPADAQQHANPPAPSAVPVPTARQETAGAALPASLLDPDQLRSAVESLLFVAGRPLELAELRRLLAIDDKRLRAALDSLAADCERAGRGIRVQRQGDQAQLVSSPENARFVAALLGLPTQAKLT
ncbi:MAG: SMC-Scp complex subunit ScpB, partial [Ktedonobacterales bacterium]